MKKESAKILGLILLGILLISLIANFVAAQSIWQTITQKAWGPDAFSITTLTQGTWFAQILLFLLIALIVYAISEEVPFIGKGHPTLAFFISVIIGLLATLYLKKEEIYTILLSYSSFGIVLTSIIPFILIAVISKRLHDTGHAIFSKIMWIALAVVIVMKWFTATEIGAFGKIAYPIVLGLVAIMLLWENRLYLFVFKRQVQEFKDESRKHKFSLFTADLERLKARIIDMDDATVRADLIRQYDEKVDAAGEAGMPWNHWKG